MNGKKVNFAFLISIILYIGCVYGVIYLFPALLENIVINNLLCELIIVLPGILFTVFSGEKFTEFLHLKRMKAGTFFAIIPFTLFSVPVITLVNLFSQFFVENTAATVMESYEIAEMPFLPLLFSVGIFAPFCEEVVCRGIYYRGYKKSGSGFKAMFLSALLFALVHMNINQAMYAFAMGMMAVLLVEATGSLWASVMYHVLINSSQIFMMYAMLKVNPSAYSEAEEIMTTEMMIMGFAGYLVITAITLPLAWALLVWMSGNEGRQGVLPCFWKERKKKEDKLVTVPLILAIILCVAMILLPYVVQALYM
ncbi:MAG: lysostaphin resistance A-like protein [Suilimivivens sp.]